MDYQKDLLAEYDRETAKTRKLLEAIPDDVDWNYKPHPKSMSLGRLAGHVSDTACNLAMETLTKDKLEFAADHKWDPYIPASKQALLDKFDGELPKVRKELETIAPEKWDRHWQFVFGGRAFVDAPRHQVFREMVMSHMVHHRAQLGVYLRLQDARIPGAYGPSADEM